MTHFILNKKRLTLLWAILVLNMIGALYFFYQSYIQPFSYLHQLKLFGSRGIYTFLVGCISVAAAILIIHPKKIIRLIGYVFISVLLSANSGILFNSFEKPRVAEITNPSLMVTFITPENSLHASIRFTQLDLQFKKYLEQVAAGKLVLKIRPFITFEHRVEHTIYISGQFLNKGRFHQHYQVDSQLVQKFMTDPQIEIILKPASDAPLPVEARISVRDYGKKLTERHDQLFYQTGANSRSLDLPCDGALMVAFLFETLDGKPLALFH